MKNLKGRHILRVGTWNGVKIKKSDLDDIVNNFARLREVHHVPLKFGHDADHSKDKAPDGQPAIGWIERVYRKGSDLFADFANVPTVVHESVMAKNFRTVSVEILKNVKMGEDTIKTWFLDAVALLGADQPAVSGLKDLADLSFARLSFEGGDRAAFSKAGNFKLLNNDEDYEMDKKEVQELIAAAVDPLQEQVTTLKSENSDLKKENDTLKADKKKAEDEADTLKKEGKAERIEANRKLAKEAVDKGIRQKVITPAQGEAISKSFSIDDDDKVESLDIAAFTEVIGLKKEDKKDDKSETFSRDGDDDDDSKLSLDEQVVLATRKVQAKEPNLSYSAAQELALRADPKLAVKYANSNGTFTADGGVAR